MKTIERVNSYLKYKIIDLSRYRVALNITYYPILCSQFQSKLTYKHVVT